MIFYFDKKIISFCHFLNFPVRDKAMTHRDKNRITAISLFFTALLVLMFSMPLMAQQTGSIGGKVTNAADGSPIAGVTVEATGSRLPGSRSTTTINNGDYQLPLLPPGDYTLKFGGFALGGIGTATFGAILLHLLLRRRA